MITLQLPLDVSKQKLWTQQKLKVTQQNRANTALPQTLISLVSVTSVTLVTFVIYMTSIASLYLFHHCIYIIIASSSQMIYTPLNLFYYSASCICTMVNLLRWSMYNTVCTCYWCLSIVVVTTLFKFCTTLKKNENQETKKKLLD